MGLVAVGLVKMFHSVSGIGVLLSMSRPMSTSSMSPSHCCQASSTWVIIGKERICTSSSWRRLSQPSPDCVTRHRRMILRQHFVFHDSALGQILFPTHGKLISFQSLLQSGTQQKLTMMATQKNHSKESIFLVN